MTVSLCIRHGSKRNYDSVSVEELDWSAESQVLIPAEHFWCDFKCRSWAKSPSPNTNELHIHYMDRSSGTPPSLEEKKTLPNCGNKFWSVWNDCTHKYKTLVFGDDEFLAQGLHLKSHRRCSAGIMQYKSNFFIDWQHLYKYKKILKYIPVHARVYLNIHSNFKQYAIFFLCKLNVFLDVINHG